MNAKQSRRFPLPWTVENLLGCSVGLGGGSPVRRRQFITLIGGAAAAWPLAARAQASRVRVGFVDFAGENDPNGSDRAQAFKQGLERLGWTPMIDYYWSVFNVEKAQRAARDVLRLTPDVIVCAGTPACAETGDQHGAHCIRDRY
jgi:hypothetical protein